MASHIKVCVIEGIRFRRINCLGCGSKRNWQPDEGVCDIRLTVHSDELFVIRQHKRNGQPDQGVCDVRHAVHPDELFALRQENKNGSI